MNTIIAPHHQQISEFATLIQAGIDAWTEAGELVVKIIDADPSAITKICDAYEWITPDIVHRFEQIGRKHVLPKLLLSDAPGIRRLRGLPYSMQEKYSEEPVDVLVQNNGKTDTLKVAVKNLTPLQAQQVFTWDGVRDIAKQRAYLFDREQAATFPDLDSKLPYRIKGNTVQFRENCTLTAHQVAEVLAQIR